MTTGYRVTITGRWTNLGSVLDCRTCGADRGLTFSTGLDLQTVTASCPNRHVWVETRIPGWAVRDQDLKARRGGDADVRRMP